MVTINPSTNGTPAPSGQAAPPLTTVSNGEGRAANGRFGLGNQFARGNPFNRRLAVLRAEAVAEISSGELRQLMRKLYRFAVEGDMAAATLILAYLIGKPTKAVDPDRADLDEFEIIRNWPARAEMDLAIVDSVDPGRAAGFVAKYRENVPNLGPEGRPHAVQVLDERQAKLKRTRR